MSLGLATQAIPFLYLSWFLCVPDATISTHEESELLKALHISPSLIHFHCGPAFSIDLTVLD